MSATVSRINYYHRRNKDGGFDTVCLYCSNLVGIADSESALVQFESWHRCVSKAHAPHRGQSGHGDRNDAFDLAPREILDS